MIVCSFGDGRVQVSGTPFRSCFDKSIVNVSKEQVLHQIIKYFYGTI